MAPVDFGFGAPPEKTRADIRAWAPSRLHCDPGTYVKLLAHIRSFEYSGAVAELRDFKAQIFQALAHPTRIAVVEALRNGEQGAGMLHVKLQVEQANLSQHLAILRAKQVVVARKAGNQVYYRLRDPVLTRVLDLLREYFYSQLSGTVALLAEMQPQGRRRRSRTTVSRQ